jgi:hypothetical protein
MHSDLFGHFADAGCAKKSCTSCDCRGLRQRAAQAQVQQVGQVGQQQQGTLFATGGGGTTQTKAGSQPPNSPNMQDPLMARFLLYRKHVESTAAGLSRREREYLMQKLTR